jgi:hypothetical protein
MLTWEDDVEVHALRKRGWTISAIARHTGRDRKTIADYLSGKRTPGVRARPSPDPFEPFVDYVSARLTEIASRGLARSSSSTAVGCSIGGPMSWNGWIATLFSALTSTECDERELQGGARLLPFARWLRRRCCRSTRSTLRRRDVTVDTVDVIDRGVSERRGPEVVRRCS